MRGLWCGLMMGVVVLSLLACSKEQAGGKKDGGGMRASPVTVVTAQLMVMEAVQQAIGQVDSQSTPQITAEVAGQVDQVLVDIGSKVKVGQTLAMLENKDQKLALKASDAELRRLQSQADNQQRTLKRLESLQAQGFVTGSQVDEASTVLSSLNEQRAAAAAQLDIARRNLDKTRITSPVAGMIQGRLVSAGDYVSVGKPLFLIVGSLPTRVHLPFPETLAASLQLGQPVRMRSPVDPDRSYTGQITDIRPMITASNRALDVIVDSPESLGWPAGASVTAEVVTAVHNDAVVVPEQCLVQRPDGVVVYIASGGKAVARLVSTGLHQQGKVEILSGVTQGETVVLDGAGFLTDGAPIQVKQP